MGERLGKEMSDLQFYTMQDGGRYTPVTMEIDDWIELYREWEAGQELKEKEA